MSIIMATRRHECLLQARKIIQHSTAENRDITEAEQADINKLTSEAARIAEDPAFIAWGKEAAPNNDIHGNALPPYRVDPMAGNRPPHNPTSFMNQSPAPGSSIGATPTGASYASMFGPPAGNDGFASFGEFLGVLHTGLFDQRMRGSQGVQAATGNRTTIGSEGGFLVPEQYAAQLLDKSLESEIVRPRAQIHPMASDELKIAGFDNLDHSSNLYSAFTGGWTEELGTRTEEEPLVRKIKLVAKKLFLLAKTSNELISDSPDFERLLGDALIASIGWYLDYGFLRGTGAGEPLGVLNDPAKITVAKQAEQAADTVVYTNLAKMLARLHPACVSNSVWVASPTTIPPLLELTIDVGTAGSHIPVSKELGGGGFSILTRPVIFTEKMPALGTEGDIGLYDFSQYSVGLRKEVGVEKSILPTSSGYWVMR